MLHWAAADESDPEDLIFVDESGADTRMVRRYGRAPKGERAHGSTPFGNRDRLTAVAELGTAGLVAMRVQEKAMNTPGFLASLEEDLIPALKQTKPHAVVVLDNLKPHKGAEVRQKLQAAGLRLLYLPPYSPDLAPMEQAWSKVKARLRTAAARNQDALCDAFQTAMSCVTSDNARAWFTHAGYLL